MHNSPDQETKLTNFLRQNQSIASPQLPGLEDRLMLEINLLPIEEQHIIPPAWQRYIIGGIWLVIAGVAGIATFQIINPPEPSIAELDQLNLFLEAHAPNLDNHSNLDLTNHEDLVDLEPDLF
jgi:hypothetical protein